jgi:pentafunctional AROM polypeptide
VEIRADYFADALDADGLSNLILRVRRCTSKPLLFTLRTVGASTDGRFSGSHEEYWSVLQAAVRNGCDFVDVEHSGDPVTLDRRLAATLGGTQSRCVLTHTRSIPYRNTEEFRADYLQCCRPSVDFVRIVVDLCTPADIALTTAAVAALVKAGEMTVPVTVVHSGTALPLSCLSNSSMTPVSSSSALAPYDLAPLPASTIWARRLELGLVPQKDFYLFGTPISKSPSPFMHSVNFGLLGFPHRCASVFAHICVPAPT